MTGGGTVAEPGTAVKGPVPSGRFAILASMRLFEVQLTDAAGLSIIAGARSTGEVADLVWDEIRRNDPPMLSDLLSMPPAERRRIFTDWVAVEVGKLAEAGLLVEARFLLDLTLEDLIERASVKRTLVVGTYSEQDKRDELRRELVAVWTTRENFETAKEYASERDIREAMDLDLFGWDRAKDRRRR